MKILLIVNSALLFIAIANMPIGYYTFLRITIFVSTLIYICYNYNKESTLWLIIFGTIAILFNPILPIYLHDKSKWAPLNFISAILFLINALKKNNLKINS